MQNDNKNKLNMSDQQFDFLSDNNHNPMSMGDTANSKIDIDQTDMFSQANGNRDRIASAKEYIGGAQRMKLTH
jgi:hypothetical protein